MPGKRAIVVSPDKALGKRLVAGAMAAGLQAEVVAEATDIARDPRPDLVLLHAPRDAVAAVKAAHARAGQTTPIVLIIGASSLADTVAGMQAGPVTAVLVSDQLDATQVARVCTRVLDGDLFGLEKLVGWGVRVHSVRVGDYAEKSEAIDQVSQYAASVGVRKKYRDAIEQCLDEMLMNALYDAPVDDAGKQTVAEVPTKERISLQMERKALVQYACNGDTFALAVRDAYGTLAGDTVIKYLHKCLHAKQQIDRKTGGAGLGLYLISNAASQLLFAIHPGVATEATCTFDLNAAKVQLKEFGIYRERPGAAAPRERALAVPPPTGGLLASRAINLLLGAAIALMLGLIAVVAYPRLTGGGRGALAITTEPPGAAIEVEGTPRGTSGAEPLVISDLPAEGSVKVLARLDGHEPAIDVVVPGRGDPAAVKLVLRPLPATLVLTSKPPGSRVAIDGREIGTTPLTLGDLAPASEVDVTVSHDGYQPQQQRLIVPAPGTRAEVGFTLVPVSGTLPLRIESDPPGAEVVQNGELLAGVKTPIAEHLVQIGKTYQFLVRMPGRKPEVRTLTVPASGDLPPIQVKLEPGGSLTVESNVPEARVVVDDQPACSNRPVPMVACPMPNGRFKVRLVAASPWLSQELDVKIDGDEVKRRIELGWLETIGADQVLGLPGAPADTRKAALLPGEYRVSVTNTRTGEKAQRSAKVVAGRTVRVKL